MEGVGIQVGYYGKVPAYGDFIRYRAGGKEIQHLDQWLQEGLNAASTSLGGGWKEECRRGPTYRFVFHPDGGEESVVGVCAPSEDRSGRVYPFVVFGAVDRGVFPVRPAMMPIAFSEFLEQAEGVAGRTGAYSDQDELVSDVEALYGSIPRDYELYRNNYLSVLEQQSCQGFWSELSGAGGRDRTYALFRNLVEWMRPFRDTDLGLPRSGLKYPLMPRAADIEWQVVFWAELTCELVGHPACTPTLFWSLDADARPGLFLFFRQPSPRSYVHLVRPDMESDSVWDLAIDDVAYGEDAHDELLAEYNACLDDPSMSLAELLWRVGDLSA